MKKSTFQQIHRTILAKKVARRWLEKRGLAEYRLRIFGSTIRNFPGLLRSFRDGQTKIAGVVPLPDLGIREDFDCVLVWSSNHQGLQSLQKWAESRDLETSGVW